jgi:hypothetical protein
MINTVPFSFYTILPKEGNAPPGIKKAFDQAFSAPILSLVRPSGSRFLNGIFDLAALRA